jgi:hypothetical protein
MTRLRAAKIVLLVCFIAFVAWIANHTYWDEV